MAGSSQITGVSPHPRDRGDDLPVTHRAPSAVRTTRIACSVGLPNPPLTSWRGVIFIVLGAEQRGKRVRPGQDHLSVSFNGRQYVPTFILHGLMLAPAVMAWRQEWIPRPLVGL